MTGASARFEDWFPPELDVLEREGLDLLLEAVRTERRVLEAEVGGPFRAEVDADGAVSLVSEGGAAWRVERTAAGRLLVTRPPDPGRRL